MPDIDLKGPHYQGEHNAYTRPEIVVAFKHIDRVLMGLRANNIVVDEVDADEDLGLGLLRLADDVSAAWALRAFDRDFEDKVPEPWRERGPSADDDSAAYLDSFLRGLRGYLWKEYAFVPSVGKNRIVGHVTGAPGKVSHGGGGPLMDAGKPLAVRKGDAGTGVVVGVLDTAIAEHPWSAGGWTTPVGTTFEPVHDEATALGMLAERKLPNAAAGHATFITGLILEQAPSCMVRVRQVLSDEGVATSWAVAQELVKLAKSKPDIINLSLVCHTEDGEPPLVLATAIARISAETVVIAAAGNHGNLKLEDLELTDEQIERFKKEWQPTEPGLARLGADALKQRMLERERQKPGFPAALDQVVAIGSGTGHGQPSAFTSRRVGWIDALADGTGSEDKGVVSTFPRGYYSVVDKPGDQPRHKEFKNGFATWGGTSFAAAKVSGAIAALTVPGQKSARQVRHELLPRRNDTPTGSRHDFHTPPFLPIPPP